MRKIAVLPNQTPQSMTFQQALDEYVRGEGSGGAYDLNAALRAGRPLNDHQQEIVRLLDANMKPIPGRIKRLYRAAPQNTYLNLTHGLSHRDAGYTSTSPSFEDVAGYAEDGDAVFEIRFERGCVGVQTPVQQGYSEIILPRNGAFVQDKGSKEIDGLEVFTLKFYGARN